MLSDCSTGQQPFEAVQGSSSSASSAGATPAAACALAAGSGESVLFFGDGVCTVGVSGGTAVTYHVREVCATEQTLGLTEMRVAEYDTLFWAFVGVGVAVWGLKAIYGIFNGEYDKS